MQSELNIRRAVEEDIADITRIYNHAIINTTATFDIEAKTDENRLQWLRDHIDPYSVIVATIDERIVGWGAIGPYGERAAYRYSVENAVYIDCDFQGMGIGSLLLDSLVNIAQINGFHTILALIVGENESSIHIHEKIGFERVGVMREVGRKFDKWLDLHILEKILS